MENSLKTKNIFFFLFIPLFFFAGAFGVHAQESINVYDSLHQYNALENKVALIKLLNIEIVNSAVNTIPPEEIIKELEDMKLKTKTSLSHTKNAMNTIKNSNELKKFLIGDNLGILKFELVQIEGQIAMLAALRINTKDPSLQIQIDSQIDTLRQEQKKVEGFVLGQDKKFSLFGWLVATL